jgi:CheY-like chemotaxis protein
MICIVTDHTETRELLVPLIATKGYETAGIECGDEVIKRMRFRPVSLVVIDCGLPDSFELIQKIRAESKGRSVPVVLFTRADEDLQEKAMLKGADAYVPKGSLDWVELLSEIQRFAGSPADNEQ